MAAIFIAGWLQVGFGQNLGDSLVAYYPFNGNANDESGNGNHLESISGELGYDNDRFGQSNSTASINKTKLSPINFNGFPKGKDNFTVSTWVNIDDRNPKVSAVIFANSKINGFQLGFNSSEYKEAPNSIGANAENPTPEFYLGESAVFGIPTNQKRTSLPFNQWHHLLINRKGNNVSFYLNSKKIAEGKTDKRIIGEGFILGGRSDQELLWGGKIDDLRIYKRSLSDAEIAELYELEKPAPPLEQGLVAYYPFNGNANDESGNGNDGEVMGATLSVDRFGAANSAYNFDGDKDVISSNLNQELEEKTFSAWVKLSDLDREGGGVVGVQSNSSFDSLVYNEKADGWRLGSESIERSWNANQAENSSDWIFVCATYKNHSYIFYRNGKQLFTNQSSKLFKFIKPKLMIGQKQGIPARNYTAEHNIYFKGQIDDVRIYNRALNNSEVIELYELEKQKPIYIFSSQPESGEFADWVLESGKFVEGSNVKLKIGMGDSYNSVFIQWFKDDQPLVGENAAELALTNVDDTNAGDYFALISAGGKAELSNTAKIIIRALPTITAISENTVADEGESIVLTVIADGTPPLRYQWKKVGSNSILSSSIYLVLKKVDEDDAGSYVVVISSDIGEITSPEVIIGIRPDTDNDGLLDYIELELGSDINKRDTDNDGLSDFDEVEIFSTSPILADTDGDGLDDEAEIRGNFDPRKPTESANGNISIKVAVELEFFTLTWHNYQLQRSKDLNKWQDVDGPFKGVGGYSSILQPARKDKIYWRLIIVD